MIFALIPSNAELRTMRSPDRPARRFTIAALLRSPYRTVRMLGQMALNAMAAGRDHLDTELFGSEIYSMLNESPETQC